MQINITLHSDTAVKYLATMKLNINMSKCIVCRQEIQADFFPPVCGVKQKTHSCCFDLVALSVGSFTVYLLKSFELAL